MSNGIGLDWLARNVHVWPEGKLEVLVCWPRNVDTLIFSSVLSDAGWITKDQWLARRAELQNKPGWDKAEDWAEWLAQDEDGEWKWLAGLPGKYVDGWTAVKIKGCCKGLVLGDWRDTLERRPDMYKSEPKIDTSAEHVQKMAESMRDWFERGELPPVGVECEIFGKDASPEKCKIIAYHKDQVAVQWESFGGGILDVLYLRGDYWKFRPIRTERDVLIEIIKKTDDTDDKIADAILAAGFSLGAK